MNTSEGVPFLNTHVSVLGKILRVTVYFWFNSRMAALLWDGNFFSFLPPMISFWGEKVQISELSQIGPTSLLRLMRNELMVPFTHTPSSQKGNPLIFFLPLLIFYFTVSVGHYL